VQTLFPKQHSLQVVVLDSKRQRSARKIDESFTTDYGLIDKKIATKQLLSSYSLQPEAKVASENDQSVDGRA
jgi:hypothetical protein